MIGRFAIHDYIDPGDALSEVLFGLIMALTFTVGARVLAAEEGIAGTELVVATIGCNVAWGVIDAVLYVLGNLFHRSQRARFYRSLRNARNEAEALAAVREEFGLEDEPLGTRPEDRARLYDAILTLSAHATPARTRLLRRDFSAALVVFVLVSATALPGTIPFLLVEDDHLALRLSNSLLVVLLFFAGYWWAHYTDARPWRIGLTVMLLGLSMVLIAVALGG